MQGHAGCLATRTCLAQLHSPRIHSSSSAAAVPSRHPYHADGTKAYSAARDPSLAAQLYDGAWHMATVTSQPDGSKGYRLFLDGTLVNEVRFPLHLVAVGCWG